MEASVEIATDLLPNRRLTGRNLRLLLARLISCAGRPSSHTARNQIRQFHSEETSRSAPTFRADWLLFQFVWDFLIHDCAPCRAAESIYGLRDDDLFRTVEVTLWPAEIEKQLPDLAIAESIQAVIQCATHSNCVQMIQGAL
jgi:hypothetical protein